MVNNFWALRREITENNGNTRPVQPDTQTRNNHQSENGYLTTPQTMQQRPQNHHLIGVNNFNQERYHMNNNVDATTMSMTNFPFSANDSTSFITAARYGRALPLGSGVTSSPHQHRALPLGLGPTSSHQQHPAVPLGLGLTSSPQQHMRQQNRALPLGSGLTSSPQQHRALILGSGLTSSPQQHPALFLGSGLTSSPQQHRALPLGSDLTSSHQQHQALPLGSGPTSSHQQHRAVPLGLGLTSSPQQHMRQQNQTLPPLGSGLTSSPQQHRALLLGSSLRSGPEQHRALPLGSGLTTSHQQHRALPLGLGITISPQQHMRQQHRALPLGSGLTSSHQQHQALPLGSGLTSSPQQHMSSPNTTLLSSYHENLARNFSSNVVGSQGSANWSRNPSRPIFHNQRDFRYLPYEEGSNRRNNSFLFNDSNLRPSGNTNRFHSVNDGFIPSATHPPFRPINSNDSSMFLSSGNANWDSTRDTSTSHRVFDIQDNEARNRSIIPPNNGFEAIQTETKELLLFKDTIPTSPVTEANDANENDNDEHLDLLLHL